MTGKLADGSHILDLIGINIGVESEILGHSPKHDLLCDRLVSADAGCMMVMGIIPCRHRSQMQSSHR